MIQIKEMPSKETYRVIQPVLRKRKPIKSYTFEDNDSEQHLISVFILIKN